MANWAWVFVANLKGPKGDTGAQGPGNGYKGTLASNTDLNTLTAASDTGFYHMSSTGNYVNSPTLAGGLLEVKVTGLLAGEQRMTRYQTGEVWQRVIQSWTATPKTWTDWKREGAIDPTLIASGTNLDDVRTPGDYLIPNTTTALSLTGGWPDALQPTRTTAHLRVDATSGGIVWQKLHVFGGPGTYLERATGTIGTTPFPFRDWKDLNASSAVTPGGTDPGADAALANMLRVADFTYRRGGIWKTNGLPVVSFRVDHGLNNWNDKLRGPHESKGIPYGLALNSRSWSVAENDTVTPAMVNAWVTAGLCEIWNHGANGHTDQTTEAGIVDTVVNGLAELREQLPAAQIDGWIVPGVGGTGFNGFVNGSTPEKFYTTLVGRLILKYHAVSTGAFPGTYRRILDGHLRQGQSHFGMESRTPAEIIAEIQLAQTNKRGLQLMIHPSLVDQPGYITTSQYVEVLDYVKAEVTAGRLLAKGMYDLLLADARL